MKDKHLDYIKTFRKIHGHYPPYIHRQLTGGDTTGDFVDFWKDFGKGFISVFQTIGNFVIDHKEIFIKIAVAGTLAFFFPELIPLIVETESQEMLNQILATKPEKAPTPNKADVDKAIAAYKADPRFDLMMKPSKDFVKNVTKFTNLGSEDTAMIQNYPYGELCVYKTNLTPSGSDGVNMSLKLMKDGVVYTDPIVIQPTDVQNYKIQVWCPANGVILKDDASNWLDLLHANYDDPTADQKKKDQEAADEKKKKADDIAAAAEKKKEQDAEQDAEREAAQAAADQKASAQAFNDYMNSQQFAIDQAAIMAAGNAYADADDFVSTILNKKYTDPITAVKELTAAASVNVSKWAGYWATSGRGLNKYQAINMKGQENSENAVIQNSLTAYKAKIKTIAGSGRSKKI
jgi:hypothetical protein